MTLGRRLGLLQVRAALQVTALARVLQPLLAAADGLKNIARKRQQDFLAAWGATLQSGGEWGEDQGNVAYAAAWGLLVALNNGAAQCCNITSTANSGQTLEMLMGVMYWARRGLGTLDDFRAACVSRELGQVEVWESTYNLLRREKRASSTLLGWYDGVDEYLRLWGELFSDTGIGGLLDRWATKKTFDAESVLHVVECVRRGWWGVDESLRDRMFACEVWPPRIEDGWLVGGVEALEKYAWQVGIPTDVWLALPCLEEWRRTSAGARPPVGGGGENPFRGMS